jgi:hypothetical protein
MSKLAIYAPQCLSPKSLPHLQGFCRNHHRVLPFVGNAVFFPQGLRYFEFYHLYVFFHLLVELRHKGVHFGGSGFEFALEPFLFAVFDGDAAQRPSSRVIKPSVMPRFLSVSRLVRRAIAITCAPFVCSANVFNFALMRLSV